MSTMSMNRGTLWEVSSRVIVYAAIGAALYAVLGGFLNFVLPGTQNVYVRPGYAIVTFFGFAFGPVAGFFTGFVGNIIGDQLSGYGALTAWNWSIANGLAGLLAGLLPVWMATQVSKMPVIGAGIVAAIATAVGFLFVITDIWVFGNDLTTAITGSYIPVLIANVLVGVILTPVLVAVWQPIKAQLGR